MIYLSESFDSEAFLTAFDAGARDFLIKPVHEAYLLSRVLIALESQRLRQQLFQKNQVLLDMGAIGPQSGAFVRERFLRLLQQLIDNLPLEGHPPVSLLLLDLDSRNPDSAKKEAFLPTLLHEVSQRLLLCSRGADVVGEFNVSSQNIQIAVLFPQTNAKQAQQALNRILKKLSPFLASLASTDNAVVLSAGVADFTDCFNAQDLVSKAQNNIQPVDWRAESEHPAE